MSATEVKEMVNYRTAIGMRQCGNCSMFRNRFHYGLFGSCTLVIGAIWACDVCDKWEQGKMRVAKKFINKEYKVADAT